jgi:hypothetical protein
MDIVSQRKRFLEVHTQETTNQKGQDQAKPKR